MTNILHLNDKYLHEECVKVARLTPHIKKCARELLATLQSMGDNAVGLAANQVGLKYHMFAVSGSRCNHSKNRAEDYVAVNCTIVDASDVREPCLEGCLSFADKPPVIKMRRSRMIIRYQDGITGRWQVRIVHGLEAAVIQHELSHMCGVSAYACD